MDIGGLGDVGPDEQRPCAAGFDLACHTVAAFGPRAAMTILAPFRANASAAARPIPELPPVTRTLSFISQTYARAPSPVLPRQPQVPNPSACQAPPAGIPRLAHWSYTSNPRPAVLFDNRLTGYLCKLVRRNPSTFGASPASPFCEAASADNWIGRCVGVCRR